MAKHFFVQKLAPYRKKTKFAHEFTETGFMMPVNISPLVNRTAFTDQSIAGDIAQQIDNIMGFDA